MLTSCMQGYITGLGRPGMAMVLLILYYIIIRVPAAFLLDGYMGLYGIWFAFLASHILAAVIAAGMTVWCKKARGTAPVGQENRAAS